MYWPGSAGWLYEDSNDMRYWEVTDNPWTSEKNPHFGNSSTHELLIIVTFML